MSGEHRSHENLDNPLIEQASRLLADSEAQNLSANPERDASYGQFNSMLDSQALLIPEVTEKRESIESAGQSLISEFDIRPDFFESQDRSLIFTAIASKLADTPEPNNADREFIADATFLLAKDYIPGFDDLKEKINAENNPNHLSEKGRLAVYDRYTDKELTARMKAAIEDHGLLDKVKARLGVNDENEDEYEVRVLSISDNNSIVGDFKRSENTEWDGLKDLPRPEIDKILREEETQRMLEKEWGENLVQRRKDFLNEVGDAQHNGMAWMQKIDGKTLLCMSSDMVQRMIDRGVVTDDSYTDDQYDREMSVLEHEYTHTQGGLLVDGEIDFGITLEEMRAEEYSSNRAGYMDAKSFCNDVAMVTGSNVRKVISEAKLKGGSQQELFSALANTHGLKRMLEIVSVMPSNYQEDNSNIVRQSMQKYLAGYDGVVRRLYADQLQRGDEAISGVVERAGIAADVLKETVDNSDVWDWQGFLAYRKRNMGSVFATDLISEQARIKGYIE